MENRSKNRTIIDPKIRHVGFSFNPPQSQPLHQPQEPPIASTRTTTIGGAENSTLSPVMIPPASFTLEPSSTTIPLPVPTRRVQDDSNSFISSISPESTQSEWHCSNSGKYSLAFDMSGVNSPVTLQSNYNDNDIDNDNNNNNNDHHFPIVNQNEKGVNMSGVNMSQVQVSHEDVKESSKPLKEKPSKAERRALQEAQRAAKSAKKAMPSEGAAVVTKKTTKASKQPSQKKDTSLATSSLTVSEMKGGDKSLEKDKKKDIPPPRMQYDDSSRVEKAKKRSVVKPSEVRNRVELFRHLPQYDYANQLHDLDSKFFDLYPVHPAVYKLGLQYMSGNISGSNARCIAMLYAFREAIGDYHTPADKTITRDLTTRISSYVSFLNECRPLSISMGNAIKYLKTSIARLPSNLSELDTKAAISSDIDHYINEKIVIADKIIVQQAATKIRDGDVLLTYGCSSVVEMALVYAYGLGKKFSVVIVDSRPKLEGQGLLRRLFAKGLTCTYTHISAVSYVMHEVTKVLLGAASILSNGIVYSRIGTACVAMVAHSFRVPVLVCCEAYKFHERVLLDSICANELGDPDVISKVPGRKDVNYLDNWMDKANLQLLNLLYDVTPSEYISLIVTDYGMVPPTSVPVIVREYRKEHLF